MKPVIDGKLDGREFINLEPLRRLGLGGELELASIRAEARRRKLRYRRIELTGDLRLKKPAPRSAIVCVEIKTEL